MICICILGIWSLIWRSGEGIWVLTVGFCNIQTRKRELSGRKIDRTSKHTQCTFLLWASILPRLPIFQKSRESKLINHVVIRSAYRLPLIPIMQPRAAPHLRRSSACSSTSLIIAIPPFLSSLWSAGSDTKLPLRMPL
jgi:hypothetical protein